EEVEVGQHRVGTLDQGDVVAVDPRRLPGRIGDVRRHVLVQREQAFETMARAQRLQCMPATGGGRGEDIGAGEIERSDHRKKSARRLARESRNLARRPAEGSGERGTGRRAAAGQLTGGRYTSTGRSEWVSTLAVTLPSTSALMPRRPCEAIATRSQPRSRARSEEHTSELQSRENLVCRLLLEKQKMK